MRSSASSAWRPPTRTHVRWAPSASVTAVRTAMTSSASDTVGLLRGDHEIDERVERAHLLAQYAAVGDADAELVVQAHDELDGIERVQAEAGAEQRRVGI